jgi:hypothetical protein
MRALRLVFHRGRRSSHLIEEWDAVFDFDDTMRVDYAKETRMTRSVEKL